MFLLKKIVKLFYIQKHTFNAHFVSLYFIETRDDTRAMPPL